jgi:hypothetical protein
MNSSSTLDLKRSKLNTNSNQFRQMAKWSSAIGLHTKIACQTSPQKSASIKAGIQRRK